ncbi:MAG: SDR family oxidoreductase [Azospirillaceae bacterium]|nr:SDR family oxidoreductase [Azospirillaceae bacterium]
MSRAILVTGANRGIGLEHVRQALAAGETVIATCRRPAEAAALADLHAAYPDQMRIEALDVNDGASIDALAARLSDTPIDMLLNNAGIYGGSWASGGERQTVQGMDYDLWEEMMRINVIAPFRLTARLMPSLLLGRERLVVMMSSDLGSITNNTHGTSHAYRSSKAALNMLTKGLAIDLHQQGVKVIAMAPGWTKTDLGGDGAVWEVDDSVRRQRAVLAGAAGIASGTFVNLLGEAVAW